MIDSISSVIEHYHYQKEENQTALRAYANLVGKGHMPEVEESLPNTVHLETDQLGDLGLLISDTKNDPLQRERSQRVYVNGEEEYFTSKIYTGTKAQTIIPYSLEHSKRQGLGSWANIHTHFDDGLLSLADIESMYGPAPLSLIGCPHYTIALMQTQETLRQMLNVGIYLQDLRETKEILAESYRSGYLSKKAHNDLYFRILKKMGCGVYIGRNADEALDRNFPSGLRFHKVQASDLHSMYKNKTYLV